MDQTMLDFVKARLEEARQQRRLQFIADDSGVSYWTISKIVQGVVKNPYVETIQKLYDYFRKAEREVA